MLGIFLYIEISLYGRNDGKEIVTSKKSSTEKSVLEISACCRNDGIGSVTSKKSVLRFLPLPTVEAEMTEKSFPHPQLPSPVVRIEANFGCVHGFGQWG